MVATRWPQLTPAKDFIKQHRAAFLSGLHFLTFARRSDGLNTTYAVDYFVDEANIWLTQQNVQTRATLAALYAAAIASGIKHTAPLRFPFDLSLALIAHSTTATAIYGWRDVLQAGRLPDPTEPPRRVSLERVPYNMIRPWNG